MSKFFIERPIFANVIAIITILLGALCLYNLPVAQYPQIVPPTIRVSTNYAGASAETVANTIGIPIEQNVNGVENSIYMQSSSGSDVGDVLCACSANASGYCYGRRSGSCCDNDSLARAWCNEQKVFANESSTQKLPVVS